MILPLLPSAEVVIHADRIVRRGADRFFGIDLNYLRDRDSNRPGARPLDAALTDLGARWLRFPGGEKSDHMLWAAPPYDKPAPVSLGYYATVKGDRMDFDEYIAHVRKVGAEPYVVVGYDSEANSGRTEAQWLESAVAWVRYAKRKGDRVRTWEVGNENWNNHTGSPEAVARVVVEFARAMKAVDPSIHVGASGNDDRWWKAFLPIAAPAIDFVSVSQYTGWGWGSYARFLQDPPLIETAQDAVDAIGRYAPPDDRARLRVIVAETNAKDFSKGGWPDGNDLGHALVTFATLGKLALEPRIEAAMVWTTRWIDDAEASSSMWYALGPKNETMPTGRALALWGRYARPDMVAVEGDDAFAARSDDGKAMTVWLLNRADAPRTVRVRSEGGPSLRPSEAVVFRGASDTDRQPVLERAADASLDRTLPPLSVTVLRMGKP